MPAERTRCKSFLTKPRPGMRCSDRQRKVKVTQSVRSLGRNGGGGWISGPPRRHPEVPERSDGLEGCCSAVRLLCCASFEARPTSSGERLRMTSQNKRCPHDTVTLISVRDCPSFIQVDRPSGRCATRKSSRPVSSAGACSAPRA
jgi:hypothetical protein